VRAHVPTHQFLFCKSYAKRKPAPNSFSHAHDVGHDDEVLNRPELPGSAQFRLHRLLAEIGNRASVIIVDHHAEATSEKLAMGRYLDGRVSVVVGTHTHVQTADEQVLPGGTGYITDLGMTGPYDSIIGVQSQLVITRFVRGLPIRYQTASENPQLHGVVVEIDERTGKSVSILRLQVKE
jgi:metallophosphoesterase (TIGR00282 family)